MNKNEITKKAIARLRAASNSPAECRGLQEMMAQYVKNHPLDGRLYLAPNGTFWVSFEPQSWPDVQICAIQCGEFPDEHGIESRLGLLADELEEELRAEERT